ncbi:hypothetical protein [Brucella rhizosphaerae]|uniref:hypothetical protein n=1 Tax=Brucella rhizosphaerae TaxID=571254 RepID=UPI000464765F|nr:hypothetical protein [Brucella rhizosphaerae]
MSSEIDSRSKPSAKELAENVLAWAKTHNLFSKVPLDEAVDTVVDSNFVRQEGSVFRAHAVEDILRKRSINLVGFNEADRKVVIFTNGKVNKSDEKILPFHTDGVTFEYVQGGIAQVKGNPPPPENPRPFYLRGGRYTCGSSIFPAHCVGAGTFGLIAQDAHGQLYGLTNNHVAGACNNAMPGLPILAPGPVDANEDACDPFTIGRHSRLLPINDGIPENVDISINCDASIFRLTSPEKITSFQGTHYDTPAVSGDPVPGMTVEKVGRTTGLTRGSIVAQSASPVPVAYIVNEYGVRKNVFFERVFVVVTPDGQPFSRPGDSGSLVVSVGIDGIRTAVGLVFAGQEQRGLSYILPLPEILDKFGLNIVSGHNV